LNAADAVKLAGKRDAYGHHDAGSCQDGFQTFRTKTNGAPPWRSVGQSGIMAGQRAKQEL
jgi:hypothetical protein